MGLIENMGKKGRMGAKLPVPTTAGDDQVIAAKTGEYVLPPEVVQAIGLDKLNALVQSITGQQPGGQPAEMPQMDGQPMMAEPMMGHALGGMVSKFDGVRLSADPLQDNRESMTKYGFQGGMGADSVATEIGRAAKGMPAADEVMQLGMDKRPTPPRNRMSLSQIRELEAMGALGEDSNIMGYAGGGAVGYAESTSPKLDILGGLKNAIIDPIAEDFKQAYWTQRAARARYPGADAALNFVPYVGAATNLDDVAQDVRTKQYQDVPGDLAGAALNIGALKAYGAVAKSAPGAVKDAISAVSGATGGKRGNMPAAASFTGSAVATPVAAYIDHYATKQKEADAKYGDTPLRGIASQLRGAPVGYANGGLISRMKGYAEGGIVEDDYTRRKLSGYNPQQTIRQPAPPFPRAGELRNYTPQPANIPPRAGAPAPADVQNLRNYNPHSTIRQPAPQPAPADPNVLRNYNPQSTIPPNATTNASPRAPELRSFAPEPGRVQPGATTPRITGLAAQAPQAQPSATVRALDARVPGDAATVEAQRAKAAAQAGKMTGQAQRAASAAAAVPTPKQPGLISKVAQKAAPLVKGSTALALNSGVNQSFADMDTGYRDAFAQSVGAESPMGNVAADTARTMGNIGDAVTFGLAGRVGRGIASAAGGGSFGAGFVSDSDRDRFLASGQPQQVAAAPQLTPQQNSDEIARRRAALEGPQTVAPAPQAIAAPAQAPARGPVAGLAARAKAAPSQPAAPANAAPMDGAVEIIRGQNRSWAVPELGYQEVPDEVYRSGKIGEYMQAQSNNMLDRADPVAAELRARLAEINAQGDNSIRVSNATDRDGKGRGLRNQLAEIELQQRQQIAELEKQALAGNQEAVQRIQQLQQLRSRGDNDGRAKLVTDLVKAYSSSTMQPVGADNKPLTLEQYVNQGLELATGTVKSSSTAPSGMKQVGTSGGKPVYQDAQGNRFIGD